MKKAIIKQTRRIWMSIVNLRTFYPIIAFQILYFVSNILIYPVAKLTIGPAAYERIIAKYGKKLIPEKIIVQLPSSKNKIEIRKDDWVILGELYEDKVYPEELLQEGMMVVDVGGHVGIYSLMAFEKVGERGKVIVAEPEGSNFTQLQKNIAMNKIFNIFPFQVALSNYCGTGKLYLHSRMAKHTLLALEKGNTTEEVQVLTLDALLRQAKVTKVDLVKIDAEGAELEILKGGEKTIQDNPKIKFIIASYHYPEEEQKVVEFLEEKNMKTKILKDYDGKSVVVTV